MFNLPSLQHNSAERRQMLPPIDVPPDLDFDFFFPSMAGGEYDKRSKSSSPMDLASSPAFSHNPSPVPERPNEPSIIGAYPKSRSSSPSASPAFSPAPATQVEDIGLSEKAEDGSADAGDVAAANSDHAQEEEEADADAETDDGAEAEDANTEHAGVSHSPEPPAVPQAPDQAEGAAGSKSSGSGVSDVMSDVSRLRIGLTELQVCC